MKKNILLPTDFSENAWSATLYALDLFSQKSCTFYFSHTWTFLNTGSRTYITSSYINELKDDSKRKLNELKNRAEALSINTDYKFEIIFDTDSLLNSIQDSIKKYKIDMVVMGTKGATGAKEFLFGSNTVSIINKIKQCPVLAVPHNYKFIKPDTIAFPTDFNREYGEELLSLKAMADLYNSQIKIVHIKGKDNLTNKQNFNLSALEEYLENHKLSFHLVPNLGKKEKIIKSFIKDYDINILVMINYEHSLVENIMNEPVIKKLGFHAAIPFLVIPSLN